MSRRTRRLSPGSTSTGCGSPSASAGGWPGSAESSRSVRCGSVPVPATGSRPMARCPTAPQTRVRTRPSKRSPASGRPSSPPRSRRFRAANATPLSCSTSPTSPNGRSPPAWEPRPARSARDCTRPGPRSTRGCAIPHPKPRRRPCPRPPSPPASSTSGVPRRAATSSCSHPTTASCRSWVGAPEAEALAAGLQDVQFPRPNTHALALALVRACGRAPTAVRITRLEDAIFYAEIVLDDGATVDARPSDALVIAIAAGVPIEVDRVVLDGTRGGRPDEYDADLVAARDDARSLAEELRAQMASQGEELEEVRRRYAEHRLGSDAPG